MRTTVTFLALGASARAFLLGYQPTQTASACTYSCPGSNSLGGKLLSGNLPFSGVLRCTYLTLFTPGICSYSADNGDLLVGISIRGCVKEAVQKCLVTTTVLSSTSAHSTVSVTTTRSTSSSVISISSSSPVSIKLSSTSTSTSTQFSSSAPVASPFSSSVATAPQPTGLAAGWKAQIACAVDDSARVFASPVYLQLQDNTPFRCTIECTSRGYSIAGVEYGNECFCANQFVNDIPPTPASVSECDKPCAGNSAQTCGGSYRMQIYSTGSIFTASAPVSMPVSTTAASSISTSDSSSTVTFSSTSSTLVAASSSSAASAKPTAALAFGWSTTFSCAVDDSSRVFADPEYYQFDDNTAIRCTQKCADRGYTLAAVEYGYECFCANGYVDGIPPASAPVSECDKSCAGDNSQTCGGSYRVQIYMDASAPEDVAAIPAEWKQTSTCANDSTGRIFADTASTVLDNNTPGRCIAHCSNLGYPLAGVEFGNECYCGSSYKDAPVVVPVSQCSKPCAGAPGITCGGEWSIQLYSKA